MNKNDIGMILLICIISLIAISYISSNHEEGNVVEVYYEDKQILNVPLDLDNTYQVDGYLGPIEIEVKDSKVRVVQENSPKHICSNQGWISESYESIICLPNKVIVNIGSDSSLDTIVN